MDKILILDGNADHLQSLKSGLDKMHLFEVATAASGEEAIDLIGKNRFSVFVTEVVPPDMDALDLLAYMTRKRPHTPCIVMTDHGKPWFKEKMAQQSFLYHLEKPFQIDKLVSAVFVGLNLRDEGKNLSGMTMASLLPLFEILQKTCRLEVSSKDNGKGYLYFNDGHLIDAHLEELRGEAAAREIVKWDRIFVKLSELPECRTRKRVKTCLMDMAGASWDLKKGKVLDTIMLAPEYLVKIFNKSVGEFKRINGYQALAVVGEKGEIIVSDQKDESFRIDRLVGDLKKFFPAPDNSSDFINIDKGEAFTLHKQQFNIIILNPQKVTKPRFQLIGVTSAKGNWFYMKKNIEKLLAEIETF